MSKAGQIDSCLLVNRRVEQLQEHSITCTEITQRRVLHDKGQAQDMHQYSSSGTPEMSGGSYILENSYRPSLNGHPDNHSPSSSIQGCDTSTLTRNQKQPPTQQVSTVTKVVREMHHLAPENSEVDYVSGPYQTDPNIGPPHSQYVGYMEHLPPPEQNRHYNDPYHSTYQDYDEYPNSGGDYGMVYDSMNIGGQYQPYGNAGNYAEHSQFGEQPPTPPSPSERSDSPPPQRLLTHEYMRKGDSYPQSGYDELDTAPHMIPRSEHFRITPSPGAVTERYDQMSNSWAADESNKPLSIRHGLKWRDPNFTEVINFLSNPNDSVKANAAAYLQHLCYMDDPNKQKTRALGGIPPLVKLLNHESPVVYRNAAGALRNLSYGRQNDENKRIIKLSGGIPLLMNLLRKSSDPEVKELVTGILWNLSSCEDLKRTIIDDGLSVLVNHIIIPHSGWNPKGEGTETCWSTVFRNTSGVLRNVSSAGEFARKKLRECEGLVDALLYVVKNAIDKSNINNKSVENCVCILRNLSYRCQEVEDSNYDKHPFPVHGKLGSGVKAGDNLGCFGASKKKKEGQQGQTRENVSVNRNSTRNEPVTGQELLWQPEVVQVYLSLLQTCSNPETLEAAAGALQNLAACYWQPSIEIRAQVRKEKGLPILVELLRMEVDRVVCAVATALRNLAIDQRNKELIGKYAMRDLVQKLPSGSLTHDQITSDDTIAAVLATLNEVIKKNAEFSRSLLEASGVERLMNITKHRQKYTPRVLKFAGQVLFTMWQHQELREVYKKHGWKEQDFVTKTVAARNAGPNSPSNANSTLNRPMASQGGTRYEDRTLQRPQPVGESASGRDGNSTLVMNTYQMPNEEIPMADMSYPEGSSHLPPVGGVRIFPPGPLIKPGEPLYAQVNREKKKNRQYDPSGTGTIGSVGSNEAWSGYDDQSQDHHQLSQHQSKGMVIDPKSPPSGGDSWV